LEENNFEKNNYYWLQGKNCNYFKKSLILDYEIYGINIKDSDNANNYFN